MLNEREELQSLNGNLGFYYRYRGIFAEYPVDASKIFKRPPRNDGNNVHTVWLWLAFCVLISGNSSLRRWLPSVRPALDIRRLGCFSSTRTNFAQALLIHLFSYRNFAVGTAYSRTEPAQAALFGLIFLSETVSWVVLLAIGISVAGVMLISISRTELKPSALITSLSTRSVAIGLCSGTFFGIAAVGYRAASLSLVGPNFSHAGCYNALLSNPFSDDFNVSFHRAP